MELISVIMPAYNAEKFIAESIESVLAQTYTNWELIIVDDGSTDKTGNIARQYTSKDIRIKYIYQENKKQCAARNNGIEQSNGKLIAFLDSDDIWVSEKLEVQLKCMIENETSLVFSAGFVFADHIAHPHRIYSTISGTIGGDEAFKYLLKQNFIPLPSVLVKKSVLNEVGGFDASPDIQNVEDYHLWLNLLLKGNSMYGMQEKLFFYRQHSMQETANDPYVSERVLTMLDSHLEAPDRFSKDLCKAKMLWGKDWYSSNAVNRKSASEILRKMASISHLMMITLVTRVSLLLFGVQLSKKIINSWVRLFASDFQNIDFQELKS